ncbi:MAG: hypothetical protein KCHDKBKB_00507 [Elusimicrobia bacterium]|nr:hypothetical protein [Elusimicrobiota bacterium]
MVLNSGNPIEFSFKTRQEDWLHLKKHCDRSLDIVIIGGGIVGAGLLRELTLRKVSNVWLFEKGDFASGTSSTSSKLIHAGIRYLEQVWVHLKNGRFSQAWTNFRFVVESSRERKILGNMAPHLIRPKPIYFVLSLQDSRTSLSVFLGVWLYYLVQLLQGQFFPIPKVFISPEGLGNNFPEMDTKKVKSAFVFWDSETDDARLVIENLQDAHSRGGHALNYVELLRYEREQDLILLTLKNNETDEIVRVQTKKMINATGAFVDEVRAKDREVKTPPEPLLDRVAGSHVDLFPAVGNKSYYLSASDNRLVFLLNRNEDGLVYTRVGTTERPLKKEELSEAPVATQIEIDYLIGLVREYFPQVVIHSDRIIKTDAGIRPLRNQSTLDPFHKSREHDIVDDQGVWHIVGVKLTDFRRVACEISDRLSLPDHPPTPLRDPSVSRIYPETTVEQCVTRTMVLHWNDYVFRRQGVAPLLQYQHEPLLFKKKFDECATLLKWDMEKKELEWKLFCLKTRNPAPGGKSAGPL